MTPEQSLKAYGTREALPKQTILKAGQLEMTYENGNLRWIKLGNTEIIRIIYSAVRDRNWGTIAPEIEDENITIGENSFNISLKVNYHADPIHFSAEYSISGEANKIRFGMKGLAQSDFLKNRIGFCILHPLSECVGKKATIDHPDGKSSEFVFPVQISGVQPARNIQSMEWEAGEGIVAKLNLSGDIFEMEDHRNWTDASFKTYCTPLEIPFPAEIKKGEIVYQEIELIVDAKESKPIETKEYNFTWNPDQASKIPEFGTAISSRKESLSFSEIELLGNLPMNHLRVELKPKTPKYFELLERASLESQSLNWSVIAVLYLSDDYMNEYARFADDCKILNTPLRHLLLVGENHLPFPAFEQLEPQIRFDFPGIQLGTGVNAYFAELNRNRPSIKKADFVNFTISPQVHAFDHSSLVENLEAQAEVIKSARILFPQKPIFVSPISFRQRFNVVATAPEPEPPAGVLPSSVDVRQPSVFVASWTLGSLKFLTQSGAELLSYFETVGWKGWIQGEIPNDCPEKFSSQANDIFAVFEALKEISGFSEVIHSKSSHPLLFDGLVVRSGHAIKIFLFSFSNAELEIRMNTITGIKEIKSMLGHSLQVDFSMIKLQPWDMVVITLKPRF